jgi:hypothetical protein
LCVILNLRTLQAADGREAAAGIRGSRSGNKNEEEEEEEELWAVAC